MVLSKESIKICYFYFIAPMSLYRSMGNYKINILMYQVVKAKCNT